MPASGGPALPADGPELSVRFRRGLRVLAGAYLLVLAAGFLGAAFLPSPPSGARGAWWALKAGAALAWAPAFLLANRRRILEGENLRHLWGAANRITLARGALLGLLAGYLFVPEAPGLGGWLPALLYAAAAAADALDGFWARRTGTGTRLGALLDGELDGLGLLLATALAVLHGRLPPAFLAVGLAKPAYAAALGLRRLAGGSLHELPPSYLRRRLAGFQMGLAAVCLWPPARPPATVLAQALIGLPLLAGFLRDGLVACGLLDPSHPAYQRWKGRLGRLAFAWAPPALRAAAAALAVLGIAAALSSRARGGDLLGAWRAAVLFVPAGLRPTAAALAAALQLSGLAVLAAGRPRRAVPAAAALLLLVEGSRAFQGPWDVTGAIALSVALLLYLLRPASPAAGPLAAVTGRGRLPAFIGRPRRERRRAPGAPGREPSRAG
jgi:CDP-diacylglycerol--glycerol-3-phosphate 3-phosphatidyltransferase